MVENVEGTKCRERCRSFNVAGTVVNVTNPIPNFIDFVEILMANNSGKIKRTFSIKNKKVASSKSRGYFL